MKDGENFFFSSFLPPFIHLLLAFEVSRLVAAKCDRRKAPIHVHVLRWDGLFNSKEMWLYDGKYFFFHSVVLPYIPYLCAVFTCVQTIHIYILLIVSMREKLWSLVVCAMVYQESYMQHTATAKLLFVISFPLASISRCFQLRKSIRAIIHKCGRAIVHTIENKIHSKWK